MKRTMLCVLMGLCLLFFSTAVFAAEKYPELRVFVLVSMVKVPVACGGIVHF